MSARLAESEVERALTRALAKVFSPVGVQPGNAFKVVQYLRLEGFTLVPSTIIGASGWTPTELTAFQAGVMHERLEGTGKLPIPDSEG